MAPSDRARHHHRPGDPPLPLRDATADNGVAAAPDDAPFLPVTQTIKTDSDNVAPRTAIVAAGSGLALTDKGVNYVADVYGSYADANSLASVAAVGGNAVAMTQDFGIDAANATVYDDDVAGGYTESAGNTASAIGDATSLGLSVMVRPLLDFLPGNYETAPGQTNPKNGIYDAGEFRAYYNPGAAGSNAANSFFASYQAMIVAEAKLAQANGAGLFCIGTELDGITGPSYVNYWDGIISAVRAVYTGKLTYSAIWDDALSPWQYGPGNLPAGTGNIATQVSFWNKLDYVGIDNYAPISDLANPTVSQLVAGWTAVPTDAVTQSVTGQQSLIDYYQSISATLGMKLIFTETGYANSSDADFSPATPGYDESGNPDDAVADPALQANLYTAFFDAWQQDGNGSLIGSYFWNWEPGGGGISPFSPQGLPAQTSLQNGYTACYAAGTRIATGRGEIAIESLRVGDEAQTGAGAVRKIIWLGHRHVRFGVGGITEEQPIRIRAHAFAPNSPSRDLVLSPDHAVYADGVLIPARRLVNGATVRREAVAEITYWHVELACHGILLAEGLPAESYLDTGNRAAFANAEAASLRASAARDPAMIWRCEACAELVETGPTLEAVRSRLHARAIQFGEPVQKVRNAVIAGLGAIDVTVPAGVGVVRLQSADFRAVGDGRRLGVLLAGMTLEGVPIALDDSRLVDGFHRPERIGGTTMRWTDGEATLELGEAAYARTLTLSVASETPNLSSSRGTKAGWRLSIPPRSQERD